jgi:hypothetical protein
MDTVSIPYVNVAAHFRFHADSDIHQPISELFGGSVDLFEHRHIADALTFDFGYGVARIKCDVLRDYLPAIKKAGGPHRFFVNVVLPNGRQGLASVQLPEIPMDAHSPEQEVCVGLVGDSMLWPRRRNCDVGD